MCSLSRYVLVAAVVGVLVSAVSGSDAVGWVAAGAAALLTYAAGRRFPGRFGAGSCALPDAPRRTEDIADDAPGPGHPVGRDTGDRSQLDPTR